MDMQVLFSEQVKLRAAMQGKEPAASGDNSEQEVSQTSTKTEIVTLKSELENVKAKMAELQRDYSELQREYRKLNNKQRDISVWSLSWKKIRRSALFHRKVDGAENGDGHQRRRRQSIA